MITNIILGTNDLIEAEKFYSPILVLLNGTITKRTDRAIVWSFGTGMTGLAISLPYDQSSATSGNGVMVGLAASSIENVQAIYRKAIEQGGACEGAPGERVPGVYAAYFRDLNGNKLGIFFKS